MVSSGFTAAFLGRRPKGLPALRRLARAGESSKMTIEITGRRIDVTPALKTFAENKIKKLGRVLVGITEAHVILSVEKHRHMAEIIVHAPHAHLSGSETTEDLYASIGRVLEKLERQAKKIKEKQKLTKKHTKGNASIRTLESEPESSPRQSAGSARVIRSRRYAVKPMSVEEAVLLVQDSRDAFLVFRETSSQRVSVVYRRPDGNFGLIEPDF